jgi:hypothetical protein
VIISRIENKVKQKGKVIYPYFFIFVCKNIEDRVYFPHSVPPYAFKNKNENK